MTEGVNVTLSTFPPTTTNVGVLIVSVSTTFVTVSTDSFGDSRKKSSSFVVLEKYYIEINVAGPGDRIRLLDKYYVDGS